MTFQETKCIEMGPEDHRQAQQTVEIDLNPQNERGPNDRTVRELTWGDMAH